MTRWWQSRRTRVIAVAVALACWPACNRNTSGPEVIGAVTGDYEHKEGSAGVKAPFDFVLKDVSGNDVRLTDLKGKPVLINFWATWCGPCRVETPWFVEFSQKYRDQGLQIVGISVDDAPADIKTFMDEYKVAYTMLVGNGREDVFRAFEADSIYPVSWIVRPDGTVQAKAIGLKEREWFERQLSAAMGAAL